LGFKELTTSVNSSDTQSVHTIHVQ